MQKKILSAEDTKKVSVDELFTTLSSGKNGLSSNEAKQRLTVYGANEISQKKVNPLRKFLRYFWGPIPFMIEAAVILSAAIMHWEDFGIIFALLMLNAVVGFWQEHKAGNAIELLKKRLALKARVRRDGKWVEVPARELVPGDMVRIRLGDVIPADVKLVEGDYLSVDQSALTGESLPVEKHVSDVGYSGSVVRVGEMDALVVSTGMHTFFGKTARLVEKAQPKSHFQKAVVKIGDYLIVLAVVLVAVVFLVALFRQESVVDTLEFALILVVAAIPAALPAVLSITLAVGAVALAKKEAIVSRLAAIEELSGVDVLCADKTGTITKNELTVAEINSYSGFNLSDVLFFGVLASRAEDKDPIDNAVIARAKTEPNVADQLGKCKVNSFKPFDPVVKRTEATVQDSTGDSFKVAKGAPQVILQLVNADKTLKQTVDEVISSFAAKGHRALGVAKTDPKGVWQYVGLIALYDPPREDSASTIKTAKDMGLQVKMVTGDHIAIAKEIASQVNLGGKIALPETFLNLTDKDACKVVEAADGFAEVFPEHKYKIVELLQSDNHIVGMTGDGVNDAPALKEADAGIAVAGATDAAKSAADIVITKPGLSVIIDAVKESRKVFQRMNNYSIYRIAETIRVLFFIVTSIIVFNFYPVTAVMIVLLALFNDVPIMAIAYDNVKYSKTPERWNMRSVLFISTLLGIVGVFSSFFIFYIGDVILQLPLPVLQSFIFLKLAVAGHLTIFVTRTRGHFWSIRPGGLLFWSAVITKLLATLVVVFGVFVAPIGWALAGFVWGYALLAFVITDFLKVYFYKLIDPSSIVFKKP
ncbi:MAG: plasma-membrane proton-efflux P-type ATPase [Candidatus Bathyarchaeia archaeon]